MAAMSILIEYPLLAVLPAIVFAGLYRVSRRPFVLVVALAWLLYGIYEYAMQERILCSGECNIRVDLLLIYPVLLVGSLIALGIAGLGWRAQNRVGTSASACSRKRRAESSSAIMRSGTAARALIAAPPAGGPRGSRSRWGGGHSPEDPA